MAPAQHGPVFTYPTPTEKETSCLMIEGLKIPVWDKTVRLIVHEPHRFATPPDIVAASELELGYEVNV